MLETMILRLRYGQLCNCIYRLGNVIGFAAEHGLRVVDFSFSEAEWGSLFESTHPVGPAVFPRGIPVQEAVGDYANAFDLRNYAGVKRLEIGELNAFGKPTALVEGFHFYANECVEKHRETIVDFFRPTEVCRNRVDGAFASLRFRYDRIVGVHIRQKDFRQWQGGRFHFEPSVFAGYMRQIQALLPGERVLFLVFSDERIDPAAFAGVQCFVSNGSAIEDLYSLSRCDLILGSGWSTFTGWGAFSGGVPLHRVLEKERSLALEDFQKLRNLECIVPE